MEANQQLVDDAHVRQYEYDDDTVVLAADFGSVPDATAEVVDDTVIVVAGGDQYDLSVPEGDAQAFIRNGVLTVEVTTDGQETHA